MNAQQYLINKLMDDKSDYPKLDSMQIFPITQRRTTDFCCTILHATFVILLLVIFLFTFNVENLRRITYPNDSEGRLCGYDQPEFPYLYFTSLEDTSKRLCVSECPNGAEDTLSCKPTANLSCRKNTNPKYQVQIYQSFLDQSRIGLICMPKDEAIKEKLLQLSQTKNKYQFLGFYDAMWNSIWISTLFGFTFFMLSFFFPYRTVPWVIFLGGIISVLLGTLILLLADGYFAVKLILFCFFVILGIYSFITLVNQKRRESIYIGMRLFHSAANIQRGKDNTSLPPLSLQGLKLVLQPILLIVVFMLIFGLFLVLIAFEVLSAWSCAKLVFVDNYPFYWVQGFGSSFLMFLIFIEFIWGLSFIKESFNFVISSYAAHTYYYQQGHEGSEELRHQKPSYCSIAWMLVRYHWGTIAGGSFMLGFFYFVDLFFDFIDPEDNKQFQNNNRKDIEYARGFKEEEQSITQNTLGFFNLIREDSFAYTYLTNKTYCDSSRYCEFLSGTSKFYDFSQTTNRLIRLNMHIIPIFLTLLIAILRMEGSGNTSPWGVLCIALISFFTTTYPLSYQGDTAEGLLISAFLEQAITGEDVPQRAPEIIKTAYKEDIQDEYIHRNSSWLNILTDPVQTE